MNAPNAIHIEDVSVSYALGKKGTKTILAGIELEIAEGEFVVVLGQTGCGKSTLLRMILGQERPTGGASRSRARRWSGWSAACGYVPQKYSLFPDRTVLGNLSWGRRLRSFTFSGGSSRALRPSAARFGRRRCGSSTRMGLACDATRQSIRTSFRAGCSSGLRSRRR